MWSCRSITPTGSGRSIWGTIRPHTCSKNASDSSLSPAEARERAVASLGAVTLRQEVEEPQEVFFPTDAGLRRAYKVLVLTRDPFHDWRILIDVATGEILERKDMAFSVDGSGMVFDPNPVVTANNNTFRDPTATAGTCGFAGTPIATLDAQRVSRTLRDITFSGTTHRLEGPFVKLRNFGAPAIAPPQEALATNFNYSSSNTNFEAVMVYYHVDTVQRYIQSLGITTAHNSPIEADARRGIGRRLVLTQRPRASLRQLGFLPSQPGLRRRRHPSRIWPCDPERSGARLGRREPGHRPRGDPGHGGGVRGHPGLRLLRGVRRRVPAGGVRGLDLRRLQGLAPGERRQGLSHQLGSPGETGHANGEIWSAALWNIYLAIGGNSATPATRRAAQNALLKALILSHHLVPANGTLPDGAEALMTTDAELDEHRGRHLIEMLGSFHDRGILPSDPGVDLHIRRDVTDPDADAFGGPIFSDSPDLWIRKSDDGGRLTRTRSPVRTTGSTRRSTTAEQKQPGRSS